jgi:DNA polymerase III delta subunit
MYRTLKNQVIRYKFLDDKQGAAVIAQKLRQKGMKASASSVQRVIEEYGLQKKTL